MLTKIIIIFLNKFLQSIVEQSTQGCSMLEKKQEKLSPTIAIYSFLSKISELLK